MLKRANLQNTLTEYLAIEKANPNLLQVWFWDESGFSLRVIRRKNWCKKGQRKKVREDRRKGIINVMGGLRFFDKKRFVEFLKKSNAESFCATFKLFDQSLVEEWVAAGNIKEDFEKNKPKIVIILENGTFHKKAEHLLRIESEMPNIHWEYLP